MLTTNSQHGRTIWHILSRLLTAAKVSFSVALTNKPKNIYETLVRFIINMYLYPVKILSAHEECSVRTQDIFIPLYTARASVSITRFSSVY